MKLLVVEDEARLARRVRAALERAGHAVDVAGDGDVVTVAREPNEGATFAIGLPSAEASRSHPAGRTADRGAGA